MLQVLTETFRNIVGWFMHVLNWFSFERIQHWISTKGFGGGVLIMFSLLFACGLGLPLPEDVPLVIGGALLCTDKRSWAIVGDRRLVRHHRRRHHALHARPAAFGARYYARAR